MMGMKINANGAMTNPSSCLLSWKPLVVHTYGHRAAETMSGVS